LTETSAPPAAASPAPPVSSPASANDAHVENNVFDSMVQSDDDFLGLLSYSLYKRHKIEWLRADRENSALEFKKVACTPAQMSMYRSKAEKLSMGFIDISMAELGEKMRTDIQKEELVVAISKCNPSFLEKLGHHILGGLASALVALTLLGFYSLYANWESVGGVEGAAKALVKAPATASKTEPLSAKDASTP